MEFDAFLKEVCPGLGLEWRKYRRRAARHRVAGRMEELGIADLDVYREFLRADPAELAALPDLMRVTVSRFFRDRQSWEELAGTVFPLLPAVRSGEPVIRAWSAGCCGGEEPFTLAVLWLELLRLRYPEHRLRIVATDIDDASLARAAAGLYGPTSLRELPADIRLRWFVAERGGFRVRAEARELVRFERRHLLAAPPPEGVDLLLCRYLAFTYYRGERLREAMERLRQALRPGGVLMVGRKEEMPPALREGFEEVEGAGGFYLRRREEKKGA